MQLLPDCAEVYDVRVDVRRAMGDRDGAKRDAAEAARIGVRHTRRQMRFAFDPVTGIPNPPNRTLGYTEAEGSKRWRH